TIRMRKHEAPQLIEEYAQGLHHHSRHPVGSHEFMEPNEADPVIGANLQEEEGRSHTVETIVEEGLGCALIHHAEIPPRLDALDVITGAPHGLFDAAHYQRLCMKHRIHLQDVRGHTDGRLGRRRGFASAGGALAPRRRPAPPPPPPDPPRAPPRPPPRAPRPPAPPDPAAA